MYLPRSFPVKADQLLNALRAALTALSTSLSEASATLAIF
jgi:hypothetical protein